MEHENLVSKLDRIMREIDSLHKENPDGSDKEKNARLDYLLEEGVKIGEELDPMIRLGFRNNPRKLAQWKNARQSADKHLAILKQPDEEPNEEPDPVIAQLIDEAWEAQKQLDPLVREAMKDNPEALAEWEEIMRVSYELEKEELEDRKRSAEKHADKSGS